eukprot:TRINITY_DN8482_c0_g2_i1.p1 TRINITY_DN8482_c0_g2~~TRINITY_DN8482_c0_g2_i1.p1  ORF type:complete len:148 (+),score=44.65 TRINITY_DN8482_c0_g2_i1:582-1025(+)
MNCKEYLDVRCITTVAGNVEVEAATTNVLRILDIHRINRGISAEEVQRTFPRVYQGAAAPISEMRKLVTAVDFHGADGLGNVTTWKKESGEFLYPVYHADFAELLFDPKIHAVVAAEFQTNQQQREEIGSRMKSCITKNIKQQRQIC